MTHDRKPSWVLLLLGLLAGFAVVISFFLVVPNTERGGRCPVSPLMLNVART